MQGALVLLACLLTGQEPQSNRNIETNGISLTAAGGVARSLTQV
jgi:hypothetical protein